ncbi:(2Fe-2S)-binding protein [bacterium]|nr:(2Fe-2S)-binding protein [bacterium]
MIRLTVNGRKIQVAKGTTLLDACKKLDLVIPTLCYQEGYGQHTSCMICVVEDTASGRLMPACSALAETGMTIETESAPVNEARQQALNLLLSEHVGDCEAPCSLICPAHMHIPRMLREIAGGAMRQAIETVKAHIAIPAVLGRICPAPCEKGCRRKEADAPVSICLLKRFAADADLSAKKPYIPARSQDTGKKIAVVGAGPAGMSAAYYAGALGHACTVFDKESKPGGAMRTMISDDILPPQIIDSEWHIIEKLGVVFTGGSRLGADWTLDTLRRQFDAVILCIGETDPDIIGSLGLETSGRGVRVHPGTFQTGTTGVFAGGGMISPGKLAVRSSAHGRSMAVSADQFLRGLPVTGPPERFQSRIGRIQPDEIPVLMQESGPGPRRDPEQGIRAGFTEPEASIEARRCLHCDCRKPESCRLRHYAEQYGATAKKYMGEERLPLEKKVQPGGVVYEQGKCIRCGLCVRITQKMKEPMGLTFLGRGFQVRIGAPFDASLDQALKSTADLCIRSCPTGALAWAETEEGTS